MLSPLNLQSCLPSEGLWISPDSATSLSERDAASDARARREADTRRAATSVWILRKWAELWTRRRWWRGSGRFGFTSWNGFVYAGLGFVWVSRLLKDCDIIICHVLIEQNVHGWFKLEQSSSSSLFIAFYLFEPTCQNNIKYVVQSIGRWLQVEVCEWQRWQRKVKRRTQVLQHSHRENRGGQIRVWLVAMAVINTAVSAWSPPRPTGWLCFSKIKK